MERRHKKISRFMRDRFNLLSFDRGLIEDLTLLHLDAVRDKVWWETQLINETDPDRRVREALQRMYPAGRVIQVAARARCNSIAVTSGDVVLACILGVVVAAEVWFFARIDDAKLSCLSVFEEMPCALGSGTRARSFRRAENPMMVDCDKLETPVAYIQSSDGSRITVSMPAKYRL